MSQREPHSANQTSKLNWLRASVLGANDGIVSVAGLVVGVAGATTSSRAILTAGIAGIVAGVVSMAAGEYTSVSSSRDTELALISKEKGELQDFPAQELAELTSLYQAKGLSKETAAQVAKELTAHDDFAAHVDVELGIDPDNLTSPWSAAFASAASFLAGAVLPLIAILLPPSSVRIPVAFVAVMVALGVTGVASAKASGAPVMKATVRVLTGGALAMIATYGVGRLFRVSGA